jgi:sugar lactone lactonase YvrE
VNPIALDAASDWLYFGPMHGLAMYRLRTSDLRDPGLSADDLGQRVQRWADKPISDGISIDTAGNLYLGELSANGIGVITPDRRYRMLVKDPRLSWVDAFSFGPDGYLYTVANQLHRTAVLNAGEDITRPPYLILRMRPLADGIPGR